LQGLLAYSVVPAAFHFSVLLPFFKGSLIFLVASLVLPSELTAVCVLCSSAGLPVLCTDRELKIGLSGFFIESDITLIGLVLFIFQFNIDGLPGFELVVLLIIQFFTPESFGASCGWLCWLACWLLWDCC
jgi:hypothetical protein